VRCSGLHKRYDNKVEAVRGLDLEVERGQCFGLLGPNGAGKTTTIEIIEGLLHATAGEVEILGKRWGRDDDELRELLGICLQETRLAEKLKVKETLELFASFYRNPGDPRRVMAEVELTEKADTWVGKLSGGQRQRLAVACSLVGNPKVLFLDEPTTGLDPQSRRQLWEIVRNFKRTGGTVLLTTHYMDEAERLCDRVAIMDHGNIIALGTPAALIASLGAEHVVEFSVEGTLELESVSALPSVRQARREASGFALIVGAPHVAIPALLAALERQALPLRSLTTHHATLEDVFMSLTGRTLRDE
jgi:ABC-2 type transport system ATP-binding protein